MATTTRKYTKVARADAEAGTRNALIKAAFDLFISQPYDLITLDEVASRAGVTKQTLLRHFGSKEVLLEESWSATRRVRDQRMAAPVGDIEGAIDNLLDHYEEMGDGVLRIEQLAERSSVIWGFVEQARQFHYDWVAHVFGPWLEREKGRRRKRLHRALIALCDVRVWAILARDLGLPRAEVRATLLLSIRRTLEEAA